MRELTGQWDCVVIGAGPAGLTAALYLARFHRDVLVLDTGASRAALIPLSRNYPGFPPGVSGRDLLARLRTQAETHGAVFEKTQVSEIERQQQGFKISYDDHSAYARRVLLATGIEDEMPEMARSEEAIAAATVRLCSICDGYEVSGEEVAVYGEAERAITHAVFLRTFTDRVSALVHGDSQACDQAIQQARRYDIRFIADRVERISWQPGEQVELRTCTGDAYRFDVVYPVLGSRARAELARRIGAAVDSTGALIVDGHQQTTIAGLYAAGDVTSSLNQISVATGQAAIGATAIHNSLELKPWCRS